MYTSEFHNAKETKEILENGSPDIFFKVYHKKKEGVAHPRGKPVKKSRIDRLETKVDQLGTAIDKLAMIVNDLAKQMNNRFDQIESRLDYIVQANNLKDLPRNKHIDGSHN